MELPAPLRSAREQGRLLLLWAVLPWPLAARRPAEPAALLSRLAEEAARLPPAAELPGLPPLPILSLDASDRVERAFAAAGVPLRVVRGLNDVPTRDRHSLLKLAGDLKEDCRQDVVLGRDELRALRSDEDKRHLLQEAGRRASGGALLLLGADPASADFAAWWAALAPCWRETACFALGDPAAAWPAGVACLGPDLAAFSAALGAVSLDESRGARAMDYARGLTALQAGLAHASSDIQAKVETLAERWRKNEDNANLFGGSENTRNERAQIVYALNKLALEHLGVSFNDLCAGQPARVPETGTDADGEVIEWLRRIEEKLDQGRAEDRQTAKRVLEALGHNQIEQEEATRMVAELQTWAQAVQESGLPPNPELRAALEHLAQHAGSAYQYLQLALPIIPGILSYNIELGSQHTLDLKAVWQRIRARFARQSKGDGAEDPPAELVGQGQRWAVLVGVNHYEDEANYGRLHVCVQDVTAIREQLVAGGYDPPRLHLLTDDTAPRPTRANILEALQAVADATEPDDLLLFYYSGHGDESAGQSYLVARDGRRLVLGDTAVPIARVRHILADAPARGKVIILDACHSGAAIGGKGPRPMAEEFIRRVFTEAAGLAILASCQQGQLSYEWRDQERSVFTHYFLEALTGRADRDEKGFVTVQDASRHVTNGVKLWASQKKVSQTPTLSYEVSGDIILARYQ